MHLSTVGRFVKTTLCKLWPTFLTNDSARSLLDWMSLKSMKDFEEGFRTGAGTIVNLDDMVDDDSVTVSNRDKRQRQ